MSEILDALKRSEAARLGEDVAVTPMPAPVWHASKPRPIWPWLAVLTVAGVVLVGVWQNRSELWPERYPAPAETDVEPSTRRAPPEAPQPNVAATPAGKPEHLRAADPTPEPVPTPPPADASTPDVTVSAAPEQSAAEIQPDPSAPAYVAELAPVPAPMPVPPTAAPAEATPPVVPPPPPPNGAELPSQPAAAAGTSPDPNLTTQPPAVAAVPDIPVEATAQPAIEPTVQVAAQPATDAVNPSPPVVAEPVNPDDLLPRYEELPYALRRDLPPVKFSMHRYADDPNQRFVVYKERRISDNGVLGQDLWLKRVLPDGAVLEFRGTEFRVGRD